MESARKTVYKKIKNNIEKNVLPIFDKKYMDSLEPYVRTKLTVNAGTCLRRQLRVALRRGGLLYVGLSYWMIRDEPFPEKDITLEELLESDKFSYVAYSEKESEKFMASYNGSFNLYALEPEAIYIEYSYFYGNSRGLYKIVNPETEKNSK